MEQATPSDEPLDGSEQSAIEEIYDRYVAAEKLRHGTKYERLAALTFKALDETAAVIHDLRARADERRTTNQIDVTIEHDSVRQRTIVECRDKQPHNKVDQDDVRSFATVSRQVGADGIMICTSGFTEGAEDVAADEGIRLYTLRGFEEADREGRALAIGLNVAVHKEQYDEVVLVPVDEEVDLTVGVMTDALIEVGGTVVTLLDVFEEIVGPAWDPKDPATVRRGERVFDPPAVLMLESGPVEVRALRVGFHFEVASTSVRIDAGAAVATLLLKSLDGDVDKVIWDTDLTRHGFDPATGEVTPT